MLDEKKLFTSYSKKIKPINIFKTCFRRKKNFEHFKKYSLMKQTKGMAKAIHKNCLNVTVYGHGKSQSYKSERPSPSSRQKE